MIIMIYNHKKMIDHFLMIMIMFVLKIMLALGRLFTLDQKRLMFEIMVVLVTMLALSRLFPLDHKRLI